MSLAGIDPRRLRMLEEIGVRGYAPLAALLRADDDAAGTGPAAHAVGALDVDPAALRVAPPDSARIPGGDALAAPRSSRPAAAGVRESSMPLAARATGIEGMEWDALESAVAQCRACKLCDGRRNTVFGVGPQRADVLVIGEAPGENEDAQGEPFVGQAGKLLDNMLRALGLDRRSNVYIANVLKCRPPANRNPEPDEVAQCEPFLRRQVALVQPRIILLMGRFAVQALLQTTEPIGKLRGRAHQYSGVPVVVTYHPAYLLRNLPDKAKAWADLVLARSLLG